MQSILFTFSLFFILISSSCQSQGTVNQLGTSPLTQEEIIEKYHKQGATRYFMYSQEWQQELDKGLALDSTIAYLWQQKAMPLFKQGKYEVGMKYIDQAVVYDPQRYLDYRAFIKCIFAQTYRDAIVDFKTYESRYGSGYVMDHSYQFYIALCKLQLNEFAAAEQILQADIDRLTAEKSAEWVHFLDVFYLGISKYEQGNYEDAIQVFNQVLEMYSTFSDAMYYKAICLNRIGKQEEAKNLMAEAKKWGLQGLTINEDNAIYERYPYQVRWQK